MSRAGPPGGLTFDPSAAALGLCGFYWRKLPERFHHLLTPLGFAVTAAAEVVLGLCLRSGALGGPLLPLVLLVLGAGLGTGYSPLVTHALAQVPAADAADARGLFTTSLQLGQLTGVATFGSPFLRLAVKTASPSHTGTRAGLPSSSRAIAVTSGWLAALFAVALVAALPLARAVAGARRRTRSA